MPPRRSVARGTSATPAREMSPTKRSVREDSAVPTEGSVRKRNARGVSQKPTTSNSIVNNPALPEIQTQQSYAYGSTTVPKLPDQLFARENMSLKQIAQTIDVGVEEAEKQLQTHIDGALSNHPPSARAQRARRRASKEGSHDDAAESENLETRKTARTAAWADSLDSDQLENIEEEDNEPEEEEDGSEDLSRHDTEPSSFPSVNFEHSYAYEKGLRRPQPANTKPAVSFFSSLKDTTKRRTLLLNQRSQALFQTFSAGVRTVWSSMVSFQETAFHSIATWRSMKILFGVFLTALAPFLFCQLYSSYLCDPLSTGTVATSLQKVCGSCRAKARLHTSLDDAGVEMLVKLTTAVQDMGQRVHKLENQQPVQGDAKHNTDLRKLKVQHAELDQMVESLKAKLNTQSQSVGTTSPLISKINYFAPGNGALIDPRHTSPTRQRPFPLPQRVLMRMGGVTKYQSKPPITALEPWQDVGDCWCSSDVAGSNQDRARLGVAVQGLMYPTELVVEHLPAAGSLRPDAAPKEIEVWADFGHLDSQEWEKLRVSDLQREGTPLGSAYARIGRAVYDNSGTINHVQAFQLDVNFDARNLQYHSQNFIIRVISNYGAEHTCLYRLRLHGRPLTAPIEADME